MSISSIPGIAVFSKYTTPFIIPNTINMGKKIIDRICERTDYRQNNYLKKIIGPANIPAINMERAAVNVIMRTKIPTIIISIGRNKTKNKK
jgi:hypothetical protein